MQTHSANPVQNWVAIGICLLSAAIAAVGCRTMPEHVTLILGLTAAVWQLAADWLDPDSWFFARRDFAEWHREIQRRKQFPESRPAVSEMISRCSTSLYLAALGYFFFTS
jgi:hypothetical protein